MIYYFENIDESNKLAKIMNEWVDTPFKHRTCVKGLGCDCIHFVGGVFEEMRLCKVSEISVPDYPTDWHYHNTREALAESLEREFNVHRVSVDGKLINGDIILSHYGKASSHSGIYHDGYVYQAINGVGVKRINFKDKKFRKQMKFAYRLLADQTKGVKS